MEMKMKGYVIYSPAKDGYAVAGIYVPRFRPTGKIWTSERALNLHLSNYVVYDYHTDKYVIRPYPPDAIVIDITTQEVITKVLARLEEIQAKKTKKRDARFSRLKC
jgi:hypothetical protein